MRIALLILVGMAMSALLLSEVPAQEGTAERIGKRIDENLKELTEEVQHAWADVRKSVDQLGVQGRVYGRLRWDKAFAKEPIDVDIDEKDTVVLTGRVPNDQAREKAIQLAQDTVGVGEVIDRLRVEPRQQIQQPNTTAPTPDT